MVRSPYRSLPVKQTEDEKQAWRAHAVCFEHPRLDPHHWDDVILDESAKTRATRIARAKAVCREECPVSVECFETVDLRRDSGVRGGEDLRDPHVRVLLELVK